MVNAVLARSKNSRDDEKVGTSGQGLIYKQITSRACVHLLVANTSTTKNNVEIVGFVVLMVVTMKVCVFWDITLCSPVKVS
jgi:hypothetical protein